MFFAVVDEPMGGRKVHWLAAPQVSHLKGEIARFLQGGFYWFG